MIWLNGALTDTGRIDPADRGFTLGDGLFETIRASAGQPAFLDRHLARLRDGARNAGDYRSSRTDEEIATAIAQVLTANALTNAAIRLTLTRGPAPRGVLPPATPRPDPGHRRRPCCHRLAGPASVIVATVTRRNEALTAVAHQIARNYL